MPPTKPKKTKTKRKSKKLLEKLTPKEAILDYRIGLLSDYLADLEFGKLRLLDALNDRQSTFEKLCAEGKIYNEAASQEWKKYLKTTEKNLTSSDVVEYMKESWEIGKDLEAKIRTTEENIMETRKSIEVIKKDLEFWHLFDQKIKQKNDERIIELQKENQLMKSRFDSMIEYLYSSQESFKLNQRLCNAIAMSDLKKDAVDCVVENLNNIYLNDIAQQSRLQEEYDIINQKRIALQDEVQALEKENIGIHGRLGHITVLRAICPRKSLSVQLTGRERLNCDEVFDLEVNEYFNSLKISDGQSLFQSCVLDHPGNCLCNEESSAQCGLNEQGHISRVKEIKEELCEKRLDELLERRYFDTGWKNIMALGNLEDRLMRIDGTNMKLQEPQRATTPEALFACLFNPREFGSQPSFEMLQTFSKSHWKTDNSKNQ
ncbi:hypothetical protein PHET_07260 [Paragonimus heterotremus]|uniref:Uncharacterized protein n=1 Tax=Paragonimus heterotremus TaxID=100268 RepID=A0A8J4SMU5_9TREM|nr:hypothetical protein PHET_07260 [Paragonimus heterotremus]